MKRWVPVLCLLAAFVCANTAEGKIRTNVNLNQYVATVSSSTYRSLLSQGLDVVAARNVAKRVRIELVLTRKQAAGLRQKGIAVELRLTRAGKSAKARAALQMSTGYRVWRDYDGPDGMAAYLTKIADRNPGIAQLMEIGHSELGRPIYALRLTDGAEGVPEGSRPAVLYSSLQHAREWISGEVNRRLLAYYVAEWRAGNPRIRALLETTELWFVLVANPDGYQYTFQSPETRLWRKTLNDNDGDGVITIADGVDPNRNFDSHWNYDAEGSSGVFSSETYRGTGPASEPETQAMQGLLSRIEFTFQVNYHSFGQWLLYPEGWQTGTPTADDPIYFALSGNLDNPAIRGFQPGIASDVLYVTNGETTDYAHSKHGTLAWTPELSEGCDGCGFVFPDNRALVQAEFRRNLPFARDVARSASHPTTPNSHLGLSTRPFYLRSADTYKFGLPRANFVFHVSYGDPQPVQVLALRSLGDVMVRYRINGGPIQSAPTSEWNGGERAPIETDRYYHIMRGEVTGTEVGDEVKVWFTSGTGADRVRSQPFIYTAEVESSNRVLVLSAEDYSGQSPGDPYSAQPLYLDYYLNALSANGIGADVYDVDAHRRTAPDDLGVLSHYDAVVWYTGEDVIPREPGWDAGNMSRIAVDELLNMREYLDEGGKLLYTGMFAGHGYTLGHGAQFYDPTRANRECTRVAEIRRCLLGAGTGDFQNDVIEYWLGAFLTNEDAGTGEENILDVLGIDTPFEGTTWSFNGPRSADNQYHSASFITTSGVLPPDEYPQFESWAAAKYDRPGGPFEPHSGNFYAYSQIADVSYKRLTRTISVPAGGGTLKFWASTDTEENWDFFFVEAHTPGQDDWTTLQDLNGNNSQNLGPPTPPGGDDAASCPAGWNELHPHIDHYQTNNGDGTCSPTGTTGEWWATSGHGGGWHEWEVDLSEWAGGNVEVSLTYASDWATQGLGVFIDDVTLPTGATTSFETGLDGWAVSGPPEGSAPNFNDYVRITAAGFAEGAVVATDDTLYMGFGFEGITGAQKRALLMGRAMDHLLP